MILLLVRDSRLLPGLCRSSLLRCLRFQGGPLHSQIHSLRMHSEAVSNFRLPANVIVNNLIHASISRILSGPIGGGSLSQRAHTYLIIIKNFFSRLAVPVHTPTLSVPKVLRSPHTYPHLVSITHPSNLTFWWVQMVTPGFDVCLTGYWWVESSLHIFQTFGIARSYSSPIFVLGFLLFCWFEVFK